MLQAVSNVALVAGVLLFAFLVTVIAAYVDGMAKQIDAACDEDELLYEHATVVPLDRHGT